MIQKLLLVLVFLLSFTTSVNANNDLGWLLNPSHNQKRLQDAFSLGQQRDINIIQLNYLDSYQYDIPAQNENYLDNVSYFSRDLSRVRFIGVHRFWIRYAQKYINSEIREDRERYIDMSLKPYQAQIDYDNQFTEIISANQAEVWKQNLPWKTQRLIPRPLVIGRSEPYIEHGPIVVTSALRVKINLDEIPLLKRYLALDFSDEDPNNQDELRPQNYQILPSGQFRNFSNNRINTFKMRMRVNVKLSDQILGIRTASLRINGRIKLKNTDWTMNIRLTGKYDFEDNESSFGFNIVI